MSRLNVIFDDHLVGVLEHRAGELFFSYHDVWLNSVKCYPISRALPLLSHTFDPEITKPFFVGLLPEYGIREKIATNLGISPDNDFQLLKAIGRDCAGALCITAETISEVKNNQYEHLTTMQLSELLNQLDDQPLLIGRKGVQLSLAGIQNKLPVISRNGEIYLGLDGTPSTHIIKPANPNFPDLVRNEYFCLQLARSCGLDAIDAQILPLQGTEALIVPRYDRKIVSGEIYRIHQEDFCQALSILPSCKYEIEGGPGFGRCIEMIRQNSSIPAIDTIKFVDAFFYSFLIGNRDAHGKNFSFLIERDNVRLAPLYDIVCTEAYPRLDNTLAMSIGGVNNPIFIEAHHFNNACKNAGLNTQLVKIRLKRLQDQVIKVCERMAHDDIAQSVLARVRQNSRYLCDFTK